MNGLRYRVYQFMQGRRGIDQFGKFLLTIAMVLLMLSMIVGEMPFMHLLTYYPGIALFIYGYYRAFSKNLYQREMENQQFIAWKYRVTKGRTFQQMVYERKTYAYFKCPECRQKMRAPKGKGKIKVKCHKCGNEFSRKV